MSPISAFHSPPDFSISAFQDSLSAFRAAPLDSRGAGVGLLNIYNVLDTKTLAAALNTLDAASLAAFVQGEQPSVNFFLLTRNPIGGYTNPWTKILPGTFSLRMGLYTSGGTQLAFQNVFTTDAANNCLSGTLLYDSGNITAALGANASLTIKAEFEITDANGACIKTYQSDCTLLKQFMPAGAVSIPATETSATQSWVGANFMKRIGASGEQTILTSPSGFKFLFYIDDDGQPHFDRIP